MCFLQVFTWGRTQDNRLGHGDEGGSSLDQSVPKDIEGLRVSKVCLCVGVCLKWFGLVFRPAVLLCVKKGCLRRVPHVGR